MIRSSIAVLRPSDHQSVLLKPLIIAGQPVQGPAKPLEFQLSRSLAMKVAPVRMAMSLSMSFWLSPKPGALVATTLKVPLSLLTMRVDDLVFDVVRDHQKRFVFLDNLFQKGQNKSWMVEIFWSVTRRRKTFHVDTSTSPVGDEVKSMYLVILACLSMTFSSVSNPSDHQHLMTPFLRPFISFGDDLADFPRS